MLTNFDLLDIAHHLEVPLVSICMKDKLPKRVRDGHYIVNLQSSEGGKNHGTHWTGLSIRGNTAIYFDPFGVYPSTEIRTFVKRRKGCHLGFTTKDIQDLKSDYCGWFVIGWLAYLTRNGARQTLVEASNEYVDMFSPDTKANDGIILSFLKNIKR